MFFYLCKAMYLSKMPDIVKPVANNLLWNMPRDQKKVYLTFDDGPIPDVTPWVLDQLEAYNAKGTFFMVGDNAEKYPLLVNLVRSKGHSIGNHTQNHVNGWKTTNFSYCKNALKASQHIQSPLFRPPYGRFTRPQSKTLRNRFTVVMWDVLSGDFDPLINGEKCFSNVVDNAENGSIIVFHDSKKAYPNLEYALPKTLSFLTEAGFECSPLPQLYWHPATSPAEQLV